MIPIRNTVHLHVARQPVTYPRPHAPAAHQDLRSDTFVDGSVGHPNHANAWSSASRRRCRAALIRRRTLWTPRGRVMSHATFGCDHDGSEISSVEPPTGDLRQGGPCVHTIPCRA